MPPANTNYARSEIGWIPQLYEEVLDIILLALKSHGLLDGETIGPEIIEENANLRGLIGRNTEYVCRSYFNELSRQPPVRPTESKSGRVSPSPPLLTDRRWPRREKALSMRRATTPIKRGGAATLAAAVECN